MAKTFEIKRGGATKVDFLPGTSTGWKLVDWNAKVSAGGNPVVETITAQIRQTSHDLLATDLQKLDDVILWVDAYMGDTTVEDATWLHAQMYAETGQRRALIRSIGYEPLTNPLESTGYAAQNSAMFRITIERGPWEAIVHRVLPEGSEQAGASFVYDYTGGGTPHDIVGDMPARIEYLWLTSDATGAPVGRLWMGLRSVDKHGADITAFANIWELEDADVTLGTDAARASDATASPGGVGNTKITVTPGTETWAKRLTIRLGDITAYETANFGEFLWLLRHKVDSGGIWEIQLRFGYDAMDDAQFIPGPILEATNTSWDYLQMGRVLVPLRDIQGVPLTLIGPAYEHGFAIQIWARRTLSVNNEILHLDCLCPIPLDEGWLTSSGFDLAADASESWVFGEGPSGRIVALSVGTGPQWTSNAILAEWGFRLPKGDGRIICVYAGPSSHDIATGVKLTTGGYFERWASLRGSE